MKRAAAIAVKDLREAAGDGRALLVVLLVVAALAVAVWQGWSGQRAADAERGAVSALVRAQWENQGEKNPHRGAHFGQYAFMPSGPAAFLDPGVSANAGRAIWLDPHRRNLARFHAAADASAAARLAPSSVAAVLQWVLPLLVIGLGFGAVAAERESGTWRLLASLGVRPGRLALGKLAGPALVIVPMLAFFAVAVLGAVVSESADTLVRIALLALLYTLYLGIFACLALGVSARASSASRALAVLLVLWGLNGFVAPRLGAAVAEAMVSLPSSAQFHAAIHHDIQHGIGDDGDARRRDERFLAETLARYGVETPEQLPQALRGLQLVARDAYAGRVHDLHFADVHRRFAAQTEWQLVAALAGPLAPVRALSQALAGTDVHHYIHYSNAAERYRREFVDATSREIARRNAGTANTATVGNTFWRSLPAFVYEPPPWTWALATQRRALLVLAAWFALALWFAIRSFRRLMREA